MKTLTFVTVLVIGLSTAFAAPAKWSDLASGQHSFKTLGENFYVDVPVRRIPDARVQLSFVNRKLVERLGLELPTDPAATEAMLKDLFAWEVDPDKKSPKTWFATHYLDANDKSPGSAMGDGRALWTGELKLERPDGKILYVDGVQKGVGPTPYAWLKNETHRDGKQNTSELIISGIRSMADLGNQLDSTGDILGFTITDSNGEVRSMTLRVGRQTRPAHIRYHDDNPRDEKKMMDYIVARDLGEPVGTPVTDEMFIQWERNFAVNNAEDAARLFVLNGFYEHPTMGNKTTTGGSIDLNGRQYLDAYHVNMTHLYGRLYVGDQVSIQKSYLKYINGYLQNASYRTRTDIRGLTAKFDALFDETFKTVASKLFLNNLGLSDIEIAKVPANVRIQFFHAISDLMRAEGNEPRDLIMLNKNVIPAAFDTRKILRGTMRAFAMSPAARAAMMSDLYKVDYKWNTTNPEDHPDLKARYEKAVDAVIGSLGGRVQLSWIAAAARRNRASRFDSTSDGIWDQYAHPIREQAESGKVPWTAISDQMEKAASHFIDPERPVRANAMLKPKLRLTAPMCRDLFGRAG
jgi:hypothetical protein